MTCDEADALLAAYAVGSLDDVASLSRHLRDCARCRAEAAAYIETADLLALAPDEVEPPAGLRDRIMASVRGDLAQPPQRARASRLRRVWRLVPAGRPLTLAGALAVAAAVALAVWSFAVSHGSGAPVSTTVTDCSPASGPATTCTLEYDPGTHSAVLTVRGLQPPAASGTPPGVLEVWLIPRSGPPKAAAFLDAAPGGGEWTAALTADLSAYSVVAATLEPPGGSSQPTGPKVLQFSLPPLARSA